MADAADADIFGLNDEGHLFLTVLTRARFDRLSSADNRARQFVTRNAGHTARGVIPEVNAFGSTVHDREGLIRFRAVCDTLPVVGQ